MAWKIDIDPGAKNDLDKLDSRVRQRILRFLLERVSNLDDPRSIGDGLVGPELGKYWRYRVGDYRIIVSIRDEILTVIVVKIGHRKMIYR